MMHLANTLRVSLDKNEEQTEAEFQQHTINEVPTWQEAFVIERVNQMIMLLYNSVYYDNELPQIF